MIAVGIDPSLTCTGVALINTATGDVTTRRVRTAPAGKTLRARRARLREAISGILAPIPAQVGVTVIETPSHRQQFGAQNERSALFWWLVDQLCARGPVVEVSPSQRAKLATGKGNAKKPEVIAAMRAVHPTVHVPDDNIADALALATAGAHWLGAAQPFNAGQHAAFAAVHWPTP